MARLLDPKCRQCRREGCKLFLKGEKCTTKKCPLERRPFVPGQHGQGRKRVTQYGTQLREKQKVKRAYGILEKQFKAYYDEAERMKGVVGENLLSLIERRLDNVVYRMGIGSSRNESRQIVNHGHITVNGHTVDIPSFSVKAGDVIEVKETKRDKEMFKALKGMKVVMPKWLEFNPDTLSGKVLALPKREDIDMNISEHLIIELYSR
ncbi:MAG: 30S ribosomal protein S4 [Clostridia bacterium]|nr:30S ribosomal protein S4 [Clostridia bacterium]MBR2052559.1 30S ribosomal protein S4 [Clostridia bacterium]MBR2221082.1 30S ribosomal protein S4 [Clostridia bacterium]MBR2433472.1 30S ribosomal protein S4 [Clostridia bacterium]MBR3790958.1 30S ribosomal protein S4 [Clostridia bacterium]